MQLQTGHKLGPFEIVSLLGKGGMGEVYLARDSRLPRSVAIKVLPADFAADPARQHRLQEEARTASSLNHPNILTLYDIGIQDGCPYIVTELLEGESLRTLIQAGTIHPPAAVSYGVQIASALAAAHDKSIIHRDLKPENIFVTHSGLLKVLDFGLAKMQHRFPHHEDRSGFSTAFMTEPGLLVGTVAYMSPEQVRGQNIDATSDIFSFGAVLFEMLTGQHPFRKESSADTVTAILRDQPDYNALPAALSPGLIRILKHCLEKDPLERFPSARDVAFALRVIEVELLGKSGTQDSSARMESLKQKRTTIAVLPFIDMSPLKDQEYFCDGIAEELTNTLAKIQTIRVASRTSAFQFKGDQQDIRRIGQQLGANIILEGSVRKAANRVRITAELINVEDGYSMWSEKYDRELEDVFAIQDEIASTIVDTLRVKLLDDQKPALIKRYTEDQEAYNLYLKGRYYWKKRYQEGVDRAVECFQLAIEKDSAYALAHCGLADCYSILGFYSFRKPAEMYRSAKAAAQTALDLDASLPEAYLSMAVVHFYYENEWRKGHAAMKRAFDLDPDFHLGHAWYSGFLSFRGRFQEAQEHAEFALKSDPLSPLFSYFAGFRCYNERLYDEALKYFRMSLEIDPEYVLALWASGLCYIKKRMHEEAIAMMKKLCEITHRSPFFVSYLGLAQAEAGYLREAEEALQELQQSKQHVAPAIFARLWMGLRNFDRMFEEWHKAIEEKNVLLFLFEAPESDPIRSDPRYDELMRRIGA